MDEQSREYRIGQANKRRLADLHQDQADLLARRGRVLAINDQADVSVLDRRLKTLEAEEAHILTADESCYQSVIEHEAEQARLKAEAEEAARKAAEESELAQTKAALAEALAEIVTLRAIPPVEVGAVING